MYERNAIVLERYFYGIFNFKNSSNLRENYNNYRKLFDCYGVLCDAKEKEEICKNEFETAEKEIANLQKAQEDLYSKGAKYEYSRFIIFSNTEESSETIGKHLSQVEEDIKRNNEELRELGEKFVQAITDYNQKTANLKEATEARENAQNDYDEIYEKARTCYSELTEELLDDTKRFIESDNKDNKKELQEIFEDNGKNERNPFDPDVILNAINKSIDIYKVEMDVYLAGQDRISKLFEEIEEGAIKIDKHTKYCRDSQAKLDFLNSEKAYVVQFLDNERMGAIYDKKAHRKLMLEACKKFALDFEQIDKLYDIILKEAAGRWTKKLYKENYNKEYLLDLETTGAEPALDTGRMRQDAIAFVNLNYWRVEGMREVYDAFENIVTTIYERDLSEFKPVEPEIIEVVEEPEPEIVETIENVTEEIAEPELAEKVEVIEEAPDIASLADEITESEEIKEEVPELIEEIKEQDEIEKQDLAPEIIEEVEEEEETVPVIFSDEQEEVEQEKVVEEFIRQRPEPVYFEEEAVEIAENEYAIRAIEAIKEFEETKDVEEPEVFETDNELETEEEYSGPEVIYRSSKIALARAIYYSLQTREFVEEAETITEEEPEYSESEAIEEVEEYTEPEVIEEVEEYTEPETIEETEYIEPEAVEEIETYAEPEKIEEIESYDEPEKIEELEAKIDALDEIEEEPKVEKIEETTEEDDDKYSIPEKAQRILEKIQKEEQEKALEAAKISEETIEELEVSKEPDKIEQPEFFEEEKEEKVQPVLFEDEKTEEVEEEPEESIFDLSKLDEIEGEDNLEENIDINLEADGEYEEDEDVEDDSILEIYFSDNKDEEEKTKEKSSLNKKVGLFQKLVGLNSKKKSEET